MRITAVTCVKNEGPFLLEWIAYNRLIGVTGHLFYSNDCTDGTDDLLDALARHGIVQHLPNPARGRNLQMEALADAARHPIVREADWVWIADVDEFLNIHAGDHTIPALIGACDAPQAISVTFQFFANAGAEQYVDKPVTEQFVWTHNPDIWCGETAIEVKTLVRRDFPLHYYGAHRPFLASDLSETQRPVWTDGSGRPVPHRFLVAANARRIRRYPAAGARKHATLNHYALRSLDSFMVKIDRGDVNREHRSFDDTYWRERNDQSWQDQSILRHAPALRSEIKHLKTLSEISSLHDICVQQHRNRHDHLMKDPGLRAARAQLRDAPTISPAEAELIQTLGLSTG